MIPETLQFQCGHCGTTLTVPAQMAGVSGPCPSCGNTVTSPMPTPAAAPTAAPPPQWPPATPAAPPTWTPPGHPMASAPAAAPSWSPPPNPMAAEMPAYGEPQTVPPANNGGGMFSGGGLPPKRAPGQAPLTASLPAAGGAPAWAAAPPQAGGGMQAGLPQAGAVNHSRLIPGAPVLPGAQSGPSGVGPGQFGGTPGSLLGRDVAPPPMSPMTQPLQVSSPAGVGLGGTLPPNPSTGAQASMPAGRKLADLREPRGAGFLRLAFAAVFLLGFLGLVGFFLKDYLPPSILSLIQRDDADEAAAVAKANGPSIPVAMPQPPVKPAPPLAKETASTPKPEPETVTPPIGFDPMETQPPAKAVAEGGGAEPTTSTLPGLPAEGSSPQGNMAAQRPAEAVGQTSTPGTLTSPKSAPATQFVAEDDDGTIPENAKPALEALQKFLAATTLEDRLQHTLGADVMKPLMERYYSRAPDGPVQVDHVQFIRFDPNPELGSGAHCIFSLENKTWEFPVPVMLEQHPDGFKMDWLAFVEFKDRLLEKFFQTYQEGPMRFHVGMIRHHYFEDNVPNIDRKEVFRIDLPAPNTFQAYAFLDKESDLAKEMRSRLRWEEHVWAIVDLEWKKLGSQQWVELREVPQMHWYSLPGRSISGPRSVSTPQKPAQPGQAPTKEMPKGISKNGVGTGKSDNSTPPPGIRKSTPGLPNTIKRPIPGGR